MAQSSAGGKVTWTVYGTVFAMLAADLATSRRKTSPKAWLLYAGATAIIASLIPRWQKAAA